MSLFPEQYFQPIKAYYRELRRQDLMMAAFMAARVSQLA